ncbi:MAG: cytochrome b/b6 domain-containing protein [Caulobacteraceae bacterium]
MAKGRVWDLPTRLTHWGFAALVPFSWWSATTGRLPLHRLSGYGLLGLLVFRLAWGLVGARIARFATFIKGPAAVLAYVRGRSAPALGHNPLGGWSIAAMLAALALQLGLGLFSVDEDGLEPGPLSRFVSFDTGRAIAHLHHRTFWILVALIAVHLAAIAVYAVRGKDLVTPMVTGTADLPDGLVATRVAPFRTAAAVAALAAALVWFIAHGLRF